MPRHKKHHHIYTGVLRSFDKMTNFEKAVTIIGSIEPVTSIPQIVILYDLKSAEELSLFSWAFGIFATLLWLIYAINRRSWPLIISSFLWLAIYIPIVVAIILYG